MNPADAILAELKQEAAATRRVLEVVPEAKFDWKPHPKSMSLGVLANHIANSQGRIAEMAHGENFDASNMRPPSAPASKAELLAAFDAAQALAAQVIATETPEHLAATWRMTRGGQTLMEMPRAAVYRMIMLNHIYHHRGQLTVYLRLLDVPLPSVYGPTADANPFT